MGGGQQSGITKFSLPKWARPYAQELLGAGANQFLPGGKPAQMPGNLNQQVAPFSPDQLNAFRMIEGQAGPGPMGGVAGPGGGFGLPTPDGGGHPIPRSNVAYPVGGDGAYSNVAFPSGSGAPTGSPPTATGLAGMGGTYLSNVLGGQYLDPQSNPWLAQTANEATQGLVNRYKEATAPSLMAQSIGAGGGGPGALAGSSGFNEQQALNQYDLGQNIGNLEANIYGGAYNQERQNQQGALGMLGSTQNALYTPANELLGVGSLQQQQGQSVLDTEFQNALRAAQWPMQQLSQFGNIFGQAIGGSGNQVSVGTQSK